ncbi:MAG: magnesium transporter, partial [Piptocephalis tieghemiana]
FIGGSFIVKKKGLLNCMKKEGAVAGEGHEYLKSLMWWAGMLMMVVGEACNFVAYAFTAALIVTPLGALSVVISAILAHFILREKLNSQGKIGCALCVLGAILIVLHAPEQSVVNQVDDFLKLVISPAFLAYMGVVLIASLVLIFYCGPRWGKTHMLVYITICSIIGSVSVQFTQGFGAAIVYSFKVKGQWGHWFLWVSLVIMIITLLLEINYLNKALNLFNTAMVTPVYYVIFTTCCILASAILYQGFKADGRDIATIVMGFLVTCAGVALLQLSRGSSDPAELPDLEANKPQEEL